MSGTRTIQPARSGSAFTRRPLRVIALPAVLVVAAFVAFPSHVLPASLTPDGTWALLPFPPPSARSQHSAIYDPLRNRMIVFGGLSGALKNDLWALSLSGTPTWAPLTATGTPPSARRNHAAIYDPIRDRMIVYGGNNGSPVGDVWALSLSGTPAWTQLSPTGTPPASRFGHTEIYDSVRDRMVVFGGQDAVGRRNDTWALALAAPAWTQLTPTGGPPSARTDHSAIYDSAHDRMVVFGGVDGVTTFGDLWSLSFASTTWSTLAASGTPPPARWGQTAVYDTPRDRMILFGGNDGGDPLSSSAWSLGFSPQVGWNTLSPSGTTPSGRYEHVSVFDSAANRMLVFGGQAELATNDLFSLALSGSSAWTKITPAGGPPPARFGHAAVFDPPRNRMIVLDGQGSDGADLQDVWALPTGSNWVPLAPTGTPPAARDGQVLIVDPVRDRLVMFGGLGTSSYLNDTWVLSLSGTPAWSQLTTTGGPPAARYAATGIYDPVGDRLIIFGGYQNGALGDVWALRLAGGTPTWTQLTPGGTPPAARFHHNAILNPVTNEMLIFGGTSGALFQDTWKLNLSGAPIWTQVTPSGTPPAARYSSAMVYDSARKRAILFGGFDGLSYRGDTWALSLTGGTPAWTMLAPSGLTPSGREGMTGVYDRIGDRFLVFGGSDGLTRDDTWELAFGTPTAVELPEVVPATRLYAAYPNPFHTGTAVRFDLPSRAQVRLRVFDVQGRLVRELAQGERPAGPNGLQWDGADAQGTPVASGTYFLSLEAAGVRLTQKMVRLR